jgi:gamma-glutamyl hercynylcysteine S-oxide synthase
MNSTVTPHLADGDDADAVRRGDPTLLAAALADTRARLLRQFDAYRQALADRWMTVPQSPELNPPLWELGHIGWFQEYWTVRNPRRRHGIAAGAGGPRALPLRANADALYNSSEVAHARRWGLALPDAAQTLADLGHIHERCLTLLGELGDDSDDALYFFRLALFHEDMHREAWIYMAQNLGFAPGIEVSAPRAGAADAAALEVEGGVCEIGSVPDGFVFDNELGRHEVALPAFEIDALPVSWARYLEFIDAGGYDDPKHWTREGWAWRKRSGTLRPRYLQRADDGSWLRHEFGRVVPLDPSLPAMNLTHHEAVAWCRWAGRRLPSEAEWELAATRARADGTSFEWGDVWEWTASGFMPYPGFAPHPYRDYSMPWFDGRPVLRGASFATAPRMRHPRYRNYFTAERNDIFAGFRSCAAG